ncbi:hypothetical protein H4F05_01295 [Vibrio cholerae]
MNLQKTGIAVAMSALFVSGIAWADNNNSDDFLSHNTDSSNNWDDSANTVTQTETVYDNDTDNSVANSGNTANLASGNTMTDNSVDDSGNTATYTEANSEIDNSVDDSGNTANIASGNTLTDNSVDDSGNTNSSTNDSYNDGSDNSNTWNNSANTYTTTYEIDLDSDTVVASSTLSGNVTGVAVVYGAGGNQGRVSVDNINRMDGFGSAAGIVTVAQNAGSNSLIQQSVSTNASVFTD